LLGSLLHSDAVFTSHYLTEDLFIAVIHCRNTLEVMQM